MWDRPRPYYPGVFDPPNNSRGTPSSAGPDPFPSLGNPPTSKVPVYNQPYSVSTTPYMAIPVGTQYTYYTPFDDESGYTAANGTDVWFCPECNHALDFVNQDVNGHNQLACNNAGAHASGHALTWFNTGGATGA